MNSNPTFILLLALCTPAMADTFAWDGGAAPSVDWAANNWTGTAPANNFSGSFVFAGTLNVGVLAAPLNNSLTDGTATSLIFDGTAGSFFMGGNGLTLAGDISNNSAYTQTIQLDLTSTAVRTINTNSSGGNLTLGGVIRGSGGGLTKAGGGTLTLSSTLSTYSGGTYLNAGKLKIGASSIPITGAVMSGPLGTGTLTINGDTLDTSGNQTIANAVNLNGNLIYQGSANLTVNGAITLTGNRVITTSSLRLNLNGGIGDGGGGYSLTKAGAGQLALGGINTYSGDTIISGSGKLFLNASNAIPHGPGKGNVVLDSITSTVTLDLTGYSAQINGLISRNVGVSKPVVTLSSGSSTLTVGDGDATASFAGDILAPLSLTKIGSGTQTLSGNNAYTGTTTVSNGKLLVNGSHNGGGACIVAAAGTLGGTGTIKGPITAAGTLAPGTGVGTLTVGNTTLTGSYACEVNGAAADKLAAGTLNITGATLSVSVLNTPSAVSYVIATYTGSLTGTFTSSTVPAGYSLDYSTAGQIKLALAAGYTTWAFVNAGGQAANFDYDNDGVSNGVEYFMGATGSSFTPNPPLVPAVDVRTVTWPRDPSAIITSFKAQVSDNLIAWTDIPLTDPNLRVSPTQVSYTLPGGSPKKFCRLVVTP